MFLLWTVLEFELAQSEHQRVWEPWCLYVGLVGAQLFVSVAEPLSKPVRRVAALAKQWGCSKLPWRFPATTGMLRNRRGAKRKRHTRTTGTHFGTGCFAFAASWPDCINSRRSSSSVVYGRDRGTSQLTSSTQVQTYVIFMCSICDGRQNA